MVAWVGFYQTPVYYARRARAAGRTHYPLRRMLHFAWNAALSFSPLPLRLCFGLGFVSAAFGVGYGIWAVAVTLMGVHTAPGWTSLVALVCLLCGSILISIGVLGEYVGRIFEQVKGRPLYVIAREYGQSNGEQETGSGQ
jgi:dolichol-phosphate mannosyltransferase